MREARAMASGGSVDCGWGCVVGSAIFFFSCGCGSGRCVCLCYGFAMFLMFLLMCVESLIRGVLLKIERLTSLFDDTVTERKARGLCGIDAGMVTTSFLENMVRSTLLPL